MNEGKQEDSEAHLQCMCSHCSPKMYCARIALAKILLHVLFCSVPFFPIFHLLSFLISSPGGVIVQCSLLSFSLFPIYFLRSLFPRGGGHCSVLLCSRRSCFPRFLFLSFSLSPPRRWLVLFGSVPVLPAFLLPFSLFLSSFFFLSFSLSSMSRILLLIWNYIF